MIGLMLGTNDAKVGTGHLGYFPNCTGAWGTTCSDTASPHYQQCHADPACDLANSSAAGGHPSPTQCSTCMYGTAMHNLIRDMKTVGPAKVGVAHWCCGSLCAVTVLRSTVCCGCVLWLCAVAVCCGCVLRLCAAAVL